MPEITMPKLSDTMTEGTLVKWCKQKGDTIEIGDLLAEVETDKATMEMESFEEGVLTELSVEAGAKVPVGARIAVILGKNEKAPAAATPAISPAATPAPTATPPAAAPASVKSRSALPSTPNSAPSVRIKTSPLARKIAASRGLALETVAGKGTGPGGRIIAADVVSAPLVATAPASAASGGSAVPTVLPTAITGNPETQIPLTGMRQIIAQRLLSSKTHIPHFYLSVEIDAAPMMTFRKEFNNTGTKITFNDIVLLAVARAAMQKPKVNAAFAETSIYQYESVNLSVAIAVEDGLVTPVIRDAQNLSLREISAAVKDLATRARDKKLKPEEFSGGTITVSNLGAFGIDQFCAIINPPQAAILAVGAITKKPVVNEQDQLVVGQRLSLTLSGDHRVVDGAVAAEYLGALRKILETPSSLLF